MNDRGTQWLGGSAPGTPGVVSNSQCSLNIGTTTAPGANNTLTVSPPLTFASGFVGPQSVYLYMSDIGGQTSGYQHVGSWTPYPASPQLPTMSVVPVSGGPGMSQV